MRRCIRSGRVTDDVHTGKARGIQVRGGKRRMEGVQGTGMYQG